MLIWCGGELAALAPTFVYGAAGQRVLGLLGGGPSDYQDVPVLMPRALILATNLTTAQTWHGHSAFAIEAGEAKILSDNPSRDNGWSGYLTGKNSTQGGDR